MNSHFACWAGHIEEETFKACAIKAASDVKLRLQCVVEISFLNSKAQFNTVGVFMLAIVHLKCQTLRFYCHAHHQSFQYNVRERHWREERVVGNPSIVCAVCAVLVFVVCLWVCGVCGVCVCVCALVRCVGDRGRGRRGGTTQRSEMNARIDSNGLHDGVIFHVSVLQIHGAVHFCQAKSLI